MLLVAKAAVSTIDAALDQALSMVVDATDVAPAQSKRGRRALDNVSPSSVQGDGLTPVHAVQAQSNGGGPSLDSLSLSGSDLTESAQKTGDSEGSEEDPSTRASESEGGRGGLVHPQSNGGLSAVHAQSKPNGQRHGLSRGLPDNDDEDTGPRGPSGKALRVAMYDIWDGNEGQSISGSNRFKIAALIPRARELAAAQGIHAEELFRAAVGRFRAHTNTKTKKLGLPIFLDNFEQWCAPDDEGGDGGPKGAAYQPMPPLRLR